MPDEHGRSDKGHNDHHDFVEPSHGLQGCDIEPKRVHEGLGQDAVEYYQRNLGEDRTQMNLWDPQKGLQHRKQSQRAGHTARQNQVVDRHPVAQPQCFTKHLSENAVAEEAEDKAGQGADEKALLQHVPRVAIVEICQQGRARIEVVTVLLTPQARLAIAVSNPHNRCEAIGPLDRR